MYEFIDISHTDIQWKKRLPLFPCKNSIFTTYDNIIIFIIKEILDGIRAERIVHQSLRPEKYYEIHSTSDLCVCSDVAKIFTVKLLIVIASWLHHIH
jgi:hypothetical protein